MRFLVFFLLFCFLIVAACRLVVLLFSQFLSVELALEFAGTVLSCAGAPGKVLVPGGGSDDLLSSAEPVEDTPEQHEELQVRLSPFCALMIHLPNV
jgi:hypothetical protein